MRGCITLPSYWLLRKALQNLNPARRFSHWSAELDDDLPPGCTAAAVRVSFHRAAPLGALPPFRDRLLCAFRPFFPRLAAGALGACGDRRPYEAGGTAPRGGGAGDPPIWPATGLSALIGRAYGEA